MEEHCHNFLARFVGNVDGEVAAQTELDWAGKLDVIIFQDHTQKLSFFSTSKGSRTRRGLHGAMLTALTATPTA